MTMRSTGCSPDVELSELALESGSIFVVRDDRLPGGTKQRAAVPYLQDCLAQGFDEFVYASPFSGFAQVALAAACQQLNVRCVLFCERDPATGGPHEFTALAESLGATIQRTTSLSAAERAASNHAHGTARCLKIPLGFDCPGFKQHLLAALSQQWRVLSGKMGQAPKRVWIPVGSGTLASVFRTLLPRPTQLRCVDVHVLPPEDPRIENVRSVLACQYYSAPERFAEAVRTPPAIASNRYYDAKLWQFLLTESEAGDLWWNVAR